VTVANQPTAADLFRSLGRHLRGTALRMLRAAEDAEDVVQEAFLAYHRHGMALPENEAGAWLHRVVVNRALDRLRSRSRWRLEELSDDAAAGPAAAGPRRSDDQRLDIERAVEALPEAARLVFVLHDVEGYKHREIAERLGISEGTSKSQLFRARGIVRRELGAA
jgi:RNA polymerase sigma-70 factor (ECF subfamily)